MELKKQKKIMSNRSFHADFKKNETYKKEIDGKDISKYSLEWNGKSWISYGKWLVFPRKQKFFTNPRILVQRIRNPKLKIRIVATYTEEEYYNNPALSNFIKQDNSNIDLKFILGILNSKMINWFYTKSFTDVNIKPTDLEKLPIPNIDKGTQEQIIEFACKLLETKQKIKDYQILFNEAIEKNNFEREIQIKKEIQIFKNNILKYINEIDKEVYKLYELTDKEIEIIENEIK